MLTERPEMQRESPPTPCTGLATPPPSPRLSAGTRQEALGLTALLLPPLVLRWTGAQHHSAPLLWPPQ